MIPGRCAVRLRLAVSFSAPARRFDSRRLHGRNGSQVFVTWELFCFNEFTVTRTVTRSARNLAEFQNAALSQLNT